MSSRLILFITLVSFALASPIRSQHSATRDSSEPFAAEVSELKRLWDDGNKAQGGTKIFPVQKEPLEFQEALKAFVDKRYDLATTKFREAWKKDPENLQIAKGLMYSQLRAIKPQPSEATARQLVNEFTEIVNQFPDDPDLNVGHGMALAYAGDYVGAQQSLNRGKAYGANLDKAVGRGQMEQISRQAREQKEQLAIDENVRYGVIAGAALVGGVLIWIGIMFVTGLILAVSIPRTPEMSNSFATLRSPREIWIERFYFLILSLSLIIFYLSVPFVILGIISVSLILFGVLLVLRVLHFGVLHRGFWAVWHMVRLVFFGSGGEPSGIEITADKHPKLFHELKSVANRLETDVVDRVYLVHGVQISVSQDGAGPFGLFGRRRRVLHLGISVLPWLTINEFRSILAHEYAHFSHRDTFYGRFIFQVGASLAHSLAVMQAAAGIFNYINPFYGLYWLYLRSYALLSAGYSRSREFLADRRAVLAYGQQSFTSGLTKVYQEGELFELFAVRNTQQLLAQGSSYLNVFDSYRDYRTKPEVAELRAKLLEQERQAKPGWFDSHPTFQERLTAVESFPPTPEPANTKSALELIKNYKELEESLTKKLTERVLEVYGPALTFAEEGTENINGLSAG